MTMGGQVTLIVSCIFVAVCVVPTAAKFHSLFEYGSFEDFTAGHEYAPQLSSFEAALIKIHNRKEESAEQLEDVTGKRLELLFPEVDDVSLATHPHKRPVELVVKTSSSPAISGNRRLGTAKHPRGDEDRGLSQRSEMENEIRRRILVGRTVLASGLGGSTTKAVSVVSNGLNSPIATTAPSTAAIGSDFFRFGSVTVPPSVNWTMTQVSTFVHFEGAVSSTSAEMPWMWVVFISHSHILDSPPSFMSPNGTRYFTHHLSRCGWPAVLPILLGDCCG